MTKKVLLKDIANLANVSQMTVSRVLNTPERVRPDTRARVEEVIRRLDYQPNAIAQALTTGKTRNIGLLVVYDTHSFPSIFMASFLKGVSDVVQRNHYHLMLLFDRHDGQNRIINESDLSPNIIDGLLILSVDSFLETVYPLSYKLQAVGIATVIVNQKIEMENISYVATDDVSGGYRAASYLINQGHRTIGFIGGSEQYSASWSRYKGFVNAMNDYGLSFSPAHYAEGYCTKEGGYTAMTQLLYTLPDMTAVFCASDLMALGAFKCCHEQGIAIPEKLSVMGYDDQDFTSMLSPALTTVRKDRERMGKEAAEILLDRINGEREPVRLLLDAEIVERDSVKRRQSL